MLRNIISKLFSKSIKLEHSEPTTVDLDLGYDELKRDYFNIFNDSIVAINLLMSGASIDDKEWLQVNADILGVFDNALVGDEYSYIIAQNQDNKFSPYFNKIISRSAHDVELLFNEYNRLYDYHYENYMEENLGANVGKYIIKEFKNSMEIQDAISRLKKTEQEILNTL